MKEALRRAKRELKTLYTMGRIGLRVRSLDARSSQTVADAFESAADRFANRIAIEWGDEKISYREFDERANRVAAWARGGGIGPGDTVALFMENRPEFLACWLGLAKAGVCTALINTNLTGAPLIHALTVSGANRLVLGGELAAAWEGVRGELRDKFAVFASGSPVAGATNLDAELREQSRVRLPASVRAGVTSGDPLFYIYTSGTTGNPKAANFSHARFLMVAIANQEITAIGPSDRFYCVLPLYHTAGGVMAVGMTLLSGAALVLRRRFSASSFWSDCRRYEVTIFQYIGELCRYLLNAPPSPDDRDHDVRLVIGNGLRPDIWNAFASRFGIREIREFYGATEGNFALVNLDNKMGAVGRVAPYLKRAIPVELVRFDVDSETHVRDELGRCVPCEEGEPGEAIGRIADPDDNTPLGRFEGYTNETESDKKVLRDVFEEGDAWYRTGDLLIRDAEGYYYFVDRIGDTFRWKGENVSTNEVAEVLSVHDGIVEANVYGVSVPGADGRAGMAAIVASDDLDMRAVYRHVCDSLPVYARPLFLRRRPQMETTGTFKHRKVDLVRDGFDPNSVREPVYFRDDSEESYVPLDAGLYARIVEGDVRV
jgi:fatty-acyl-CoA synthase